MDRYNLLDRVGKGTYGVVYKAKDKKSSETVALKTISLIEEEGIPSTAIREIALLKFLKHQNIVVMHDVIHMSDKLTMVFEFSSLTSKSTSTLARPDSTSSPSSLSSTSFSSVSPFATSRRSYTATSSRRTCC